MEERMASNVVTSETREAFMAKRLDLAVPEKPKEAEAPKEEEQKEEEHPGKEDEEKTRPRGRAPEGKVWFKGKWTDKHDINYRFSVKSEEAKKASEEARKERQAREKLERDIDELRKKPAGQAQIEVGAEPKREQFASDQEYQTALIDYRVEKKLSDRQKADAEERAKAEQDRMIKTYAERLAAVKAETPDYDERIEAQKDLQIPAHIRDAIFESEVGPLIALHFADHPAEAERLSKLNEKAALREFGKIEAMIETEASERKEAERKEPVKLIEVSQAPAPIVPLKGSTGSLDTKVDSAGRFTGTYAEYKALRKAGKLK